MASHPRVQLDMTRNYWSGAARYVALTAALLAVILGLVAGTARYAFGSVSHALAYVRGDRLFVAEPIVSLGQVEAGKVRDVTFRLVNLTSRRYQVIGCTTSCGCTTAEPLPSAIPPAGESLFTLQFTPQADRSEPVDVRLFTDCPTKPELQLRIAAQALRSPSATASPSEHP